MISFQSIKAGFTLKEPAFFRDLLKLVFRYENKGKIVDIKFVFCDDDFLLGINKNYLNHDTLTDIITFPVIGNKKEIISGEIYISIDRILENSNIYDQKFQKELSRVMVHGILHLLGYNDLLDSEKLEMREREDYYLNLQPPKN